MDSARGGQKAAHVDGVLSAAQTAPILSSNAFLSAKVAARGTSVRYQRGKVIFSQGDSTDYVLMLLEGRVKVSVHSRGGREALLNILGPGDFFGLVGLNREPARSASATAITDSTVFRISAALMWQSLRDDTTFFEWFIANMAERSARIHEYLADQLLNSTEQRLARALLRLANPGRGDSSAANISGVSHEMLAGMVGTTRPRVTHFMNKFRRLGMIEYSAEGVQVGAGLRDFVQRD